MIKHYSKYINNNIVNKPNKKIYDNTIYALDIETTNYIIHDNSIYSSIYYDKLSENEKKDCIKQSFMYVWQLSINEQVYYGRTWSELEEFIKKIDNSNSYRKILFIHNASFEFHALLNKFKFTEVFARKTRKIMKCSFKDYNIEIRCTYMLTNMSLADLAKNYDLPLKKLKYDYNKIRLPITHLTKKELKYIENDCLIIYHYITKIELPKYKFINKIPLTLTGHVRQELRSVVHKNASYKRKTRKSINTNPLIYNFLTKAYWGGYTHSNWIFTDYLLKNVTSYDITSSYPYSLCVFKYPMSKFEECFISDENDLLDTFAYLLKVKFYEIECLYNNNFISRHKCIEIENAEYDNGRIIKADSLTIILTDVDFKFILKSYKKKKIEIIQAFYAKYDYLPIELVHFILDKYVNKTQYKNVEGKEIIYQINKSMFNAIYGMTTTNVIRDEVVFSDVWQKWKDERKLKNDEIIEKLLDLEKEGFLSYAWGVWDTAYSRNNILNLCLLYDDYCAYIDTDSLKLVKGYDEKYINDYNNNVYEKIKKICEKRDIDIELFRPRDKDGVKHLMGIIENEGEYQEFITQGAKKYAYRKNDKLHIVVSGVPKSGVECLNNDINKFKDNLIFSYNKTNKMTLIYNDNQIPVTITDYQNNTLTINEKNGIVTLPATYSLNKAQEYARLVLEGSSRRSLYETI